MSTAERESDLDQVRETRDLADRAERLAFALERMNVAQYVELLQRPGRLMYLNFLAGLARGLGIALGFSALGGLFVIVLQRIVVLNLPVIGAWIAELVTIIQGQLGP